MSPRSFPRPKRNLLTFDDAYPALDIVRGPSHSGWYECRCPVHNDEHASMGVKEGDEGGLIVVCHSGCEIGEIIKAIRELI